VDATFLADQVARHILEEEEAHELIEDLSYRLAKETYRL
jgi:glucuronate isomerase